MRITVHSAAASNALADPSNYQGKSAGANVARSSLESQARRGVFAMALTQTGNIEATPSRAQSNEMAVELIRNGCSIFQDEREILASRTGVEPVSPP